ncbi:unnamed protein product, partial [Cyprideis torosa]
AKATYLGFNFFARSPRFVSLEAARALTISVPAGMAKVALVVDADDAFLDALVQTVPLDMIQFHGTESPHRVAEVRARLGLPVMKAIGVADKEDLANIARFEAAADQILIDAKPPKNAILPGGNGLVFDWRLIAGRRWARPWMLAGGLTPENAAAAVETTGARQLDVASGVESASGIKDADKMAAFVRAAQGAQPVPRL